MAAVMSSGGGLYEKVAERERRKDIIKGARFSAAYPLKVNKRRGHFPDENIKPIQFLQQYHVRGRDIRYALPYSVHIKQRW